MALDLLVPNNEAKTMTTSKHHDVGFIQEDSENELTINEISSMGDGDWK